MQSVIGMQDIAIFYTMSLDLQHGAQMSLMLLVMDRNDDTVVWLC
jgi:hypothetical protein